MSSIQEIKALVNAAEHEVHIAKDALKATEKAIEEAHERNRIAKTTHDALINKLKNVKAQFREQIMEEGLRESNRWNDMYKKLLVWKENNNGDVLVAVDKDSDEETKKLSRWVINQRSSYKYFMNGDTKHIKDHRIDALNKIGFIWSVADHAFEGNVQELKEYHAEHNKFDVPVKTNKKLAAFVSRVRSAYANKQEGRAQNDLTDEKINQLNAIGFKWDFKKSRKRAAAESSTTMEYDTMYNLLLEFKQQYGHTKVNRLIKEWQKGVGEPSKKEFRRLPVFLTYARKQHIEFQEGRPSMLDAEKIKQLSELGVEWKMPPNVPRRNTGGETSRKKKPKIDLPSQELELNVEGMATAGIVLPALPSPDPNLAGPSPGNKSIVI